MKATLTFDTDDEPIANVLLAVLACYGSDYEILVPDDEEKEKDA